jgi:protein phosphatase
MGRVRFAGLSDAGCVRLENEDRWGADPEQGLFLVSDGIAGAFAGGLAATVVVETLPPLLRQRLSGLKDLAAPEARERLLAAVSELSEQMYTSSQGQPGLEGMGATVALVLLRGGQALIAHLGDSRAYRLPPLPPPHAGGVGGGAG